MKAIYRKFLAMLLAMVMLVSMMPMSAFADEAENEITEAEETEVYSEVIEEEEFEAEAEEVDAEEPVIAEEEESFDASEKEIEETPAEEPEENEEIIVEETEEPEEAEVVGVEFICLQEGTVISVYKAAERAADKNAKAIEPEDENYYLLTVGEYVLDAQCSGYDSIVNAKFTVDASDEIIMLMVDMENGEIITCLESIPALTYAASVANSTSEVVQKLNSWKSKLNGKYWNYYDRSQWDDRRTEVENNLKAVVTNGWLDSSNPSNAQLGVTSTACPGKTYATGCKSNYFGGGWQCYGFAWFIEYALFQSTYSSNPSDWNVYSGNSLNSITLQPGDLVRVSGHSIVVSDTTNGALNCVEGWGGSGCKIVWSPGFNWNEYTTTSSMLSAVKSNGGTVYRIKKLDVSAPVVKNVTVTVNGTNVHVTYTPQGPASYYDVYLIQDPWGWEAVTGHIQTTNSEATFTNVAPGDYQVFVISRPNPDTRQSEWSGLFTVTESKNILYVNGNYYGTETFGIDNLGRFDLYINGQLAGSNLSGVNSPYPVGTRYEIKNIQPLYGYQYDGVYSGTLSGTISADTKVILSFSLIVPDAPPNIKVTYLNDGSARISWDPVNYATTYEVQRVPIKDGASYTVDWNYTSGTSYTTTGLETSAQWQFAVRAMNNIVNSVWRYSDYYTAFLSTPQNVTVTYVNDGSAYISWDPVAGATSYEVQRIPIKDGANYAIDPNYTSGTAYTTTGLETSKQWQFAVRAKYQERASASFGYSEYYYAPHIAVNENNFPDAAFRSYVCNLLGVSEGSIVSLDRFEAVKYIDVNSKNIANLKGIEFFTELNTLYCYNNNLSTLDISSNTALEILDCYRNSIAALDAGNNAKLTTLNCESNKLTTLNVSNCTVLRKLGCSYNNLSALDVSRCTSLVVLSCSVNSISALNVSSFAGLQELYCSDNQLTALNLSNNTALQRLNCFHNKMKAIDLSKTAIPAGNIFTYDDYTANSITLPASYALIDSADCCGTNLRWKLKDGVLTISGTGDMYDYENGAPWAEQKEAINEVVLSVGITNIGDNAFFGCSGLSKITIPDSVTDIGEGAFVGCTSLKTLYIPESVMSISCQQADDCLFKDCAQDLTIYCGAESCPSGWGNYWNYNGSSYLAVNFGVRREDVSTDIASGSCGANLDWTLTEEGTLVISGTGSMSDYTYDNGAPWSEQKEAIKEVVISAGVTSIGDWAFLDCSIEKVTIPDTVTSVGNNSFNSCSALSSVIIPNSVTSIGENAFSICSNLANVVFPDSVQSLGSGIFANCIGLTSFELPDGIEMIPGDMFYSCSGLTSITIPASVTNIGGSAFSSSGLTSVTIPGNVTDIGDHAFMECSSLASVIMMPGVQTMGTSAFAYCENLTNVVIPNTVTSIGDSAFTRCPNLTSLNIPDSVKTIGSKAFYRNTEIFYCGTEAEWNSTGSDSIGKEIHYSAHTLEIIAGKEATCTEKGLTEGSHCTICDKVITAQTEIPFADHKTELRNHKDASETEAGYTGDLVCTVCGEMVSKGTIIEPTGDTEGAAEISVSSAKVICGSETDVSISISEDSNICAMQLTAVYDASVLQLVSAEAGSITNFASATINTDEPGKIYIAWDDNNALASGGVLLNIRFKSITDTDTTTVVRVLSASEDDDFTCLEYVGGNYNEVPCVFRSGTVKVSTVMIGDVSGDGKVNVMDANMIRRYAAKAITLTDIQLLAGDVSGDGKVNVMDANLIRRYAAKLIDTFPAA